MQKTHTFVVLAYKESPYLEDCINSLLQQTVPSEVFISTSTPNNYISALAKKHALKVVVNRGEKGLAADWNFALQQAKTAYVTLAHQDDIYLPFYTEQMLQDVEQYPDFLLKFCDYQEIYHGPKITKVRTWTLNLLIKRILLFGNFFFAPAISSPRTKRDLLRFGSPIPCPSVLYHKARLKHFAFNQDFQINVDWDAWIRLAQQKGEFIKISKIAMQHRIHAASETSRGLIGNIRQKEDLRCFTRLWSRKIAKFLYPLYTLSYWTNF